MAIMNRVKELRKAAGLTQLDLAERVHVSRQTIISLEKGSYVPSLELALDIAAVFDMQVEAIFKKAVE